MKPFFSLLGICVVSLARAQELTLEAALRQALQHNPAIAGAKAEVDAARAEADVAKSKLLPQVGATGFISRSNMPMILQGPIASDPRALVLSPEDEFADLNIMLMMPLHTGGVLSGLVAASVAKQQAAEAEASGMAAEVALMVRESYARAQYGSSLVEAEQSRIEAAKGMVSLARAQFEAGKGIEASIRRAEAELAEAEQDLTMAENDRKKMLLDLLASMGASMSDLPSVSRTASFQPVSDSLENFLEKAKTARGELLASRGRLKAAENQARSARGALQPQVYGFAMSDTFAPRDEMGRRSGYSVGVVASLPLFVGGMRRSEAAAGKAMAEKARQEVRSWEIRTEKEVRQAWLDVRTATQNFETARSALSAAKSAYDVVAVRIEAGKAILVEQLDALSTLTRARTNVAKAVTDHEIAKARVLRAVGLTFESNGGTTK